MRTRPAAVWEPFVRAAIALALTAGFGLGGGLFAVQALGLPLGVWWPASAQAHGHAQLFGWAGLMVLGVGLHFLPRLRGAPPDPPASARAVLWLLVGGFVLRAVAQPALAFAVPGTLPPVAYFAPAFAGLLELAGATLVVRSLVRTFRQGPPLQERKSILPVLPFFLTAFASFWLALAVNLAGLLAAGLAGSLLAAPLFDSLTVQLALYGFLVPVSVAMSSRTFALYFRTPLARPRVLGTGLGLLLIGLVLRALGEVAIMPPAAGVGRLIHAAALFAFAVGLGIFEPRRPLPRQPLRPFSDPIQLHAISAFVWLAAAAAMLVATGLTLIGAASVFVPLDVERHALGAGFVTVLILGMAAHMLPGFAGWPLRSGALVWTTFILGNLAAVLRVGPLLLPIGTPAFTRGVLAAAGLAGLLAIAVLACNLTTPRVAGVDRPIPRRHGLKKQPAGDQGQAASNSQPAGARSQS